MKKIAKKTLTSILVLTMILSLFIFPGAAAKTSLLMIHIKDDTGARISGQNITIQLRDKETGKFFGSGSDPQFTTTNGRFYIPDIPAGTYEIIIKELNPNYVVNPKQDMTVIIKADSEITKEIKTTYTQFSLTVKAKKFSGVTVSESPYGKLTKFIYQEVPDTEYGLFTDEAIFVPNFGTGKDSFYEGIKIINGSGTTILPVPAAKYYLQEIKEISGYGGFKTISDQKYPLKLIGNGKDSFIEQEIFIPNNIINIQISQFIENRASSSDGNGFVFGLYTSEDLSLKAASNNGADKTIHIPVNTLVEILTTDSDGQISFSEQLPEGRYYVKLLSAPLSYITDAETQYPFEVSETETTSIQIIPNKARAKNILGDINNDGEVNASDAAQLSRHLAKWDVFCHVKTADINGDGNVDSGDSVLLNRWLAKWAIPYEIGNASNK